MEKEILKIADDAVIGVVNPLKAYIDLKRIEKAVTLALKSVNDSAINESKKYGQRSFEDFGAQIEIRSNAGKWSYEHIPDWVKLKEELRNLEESRKIAFKQKAGFSMVDTATGEELTPAHYEEGKENIFIKLK